MNTSKKPRLSQPQTLSARHAPPMRQAQQALPASKTLPALQALQIDAPARMRFALMCLALAGLALASLALLAACDRPQAGPATELRFGFISEPATLDPLSPANTADGRSILFNVFEGLVKPDPEGRHLLALAESYSMEEMGRVYVFRLRENVLFHDGAPLTQADVIFTLETAAAAGLVGMDAIESVEAVGERDLRITLRSPDPDFLPYLTVGVVRAGSADRDRVAVGTGPFRVESHTVQQSMVLRRFEYYWQENVPSLEKVTLVFLADLNAKFLALQGGSIDGAFFTAGIAHQIDRARFDVTHVYAARVQRLVLNNAAPPLDDIRVRRALNYGIDPQGIIDLVFFGYGRRAGGPVIPGLVAYYEPSLVGAYPHDPERAIALLAEAGFGEGGERGRLSLEITVPSNFTQHVDTAQVIVAQLAGIGVDASIQLVDWATWLAEVNRDRNYQVTIISVDGRTVSPRSFLDRYRSDSGSNFVNFSSADFDRVFDMAIAEADEGRRIELYREAQRILSYNAASVYIQDILGSMAFRAGAFGGVLGYPLAAIDFASMYAR